MSEARHAPYTQTIRAGGNVGPLLIGVGPHGRAEAKRRGSDDQWLDELALSYLPNDDVGGYAWSIARGAFVVLIDTGAERSTLRSFASALLHRWGARAVALASPNGRYLFTFKGGR